MKTNDEILASWDTNSIYADWYAIDSYDPDDGVIRRLFVGTEDEAYALMNSSYLEPHGLHGEPFYRIKVIGGDDARAFFEGNVCELPDERGVYDVNEAAGMLGISRQRVHQLIQDGKLDGRKVGKTWYVYRHSVEARKRNA